MEYSFNECNYVNWLIWCNRGPCISLSLLWSKGFPSITRSRLHLWSGFCLPTREELVSFTEKPSILCFPPKKGWISSSYLSSGFAKHLDKYCISIHHTAKWKMNLGTVFSLLFCDSKRIDHQLRTTGLVLLLFICSTAYFCILYCLMLCLKTRMYSILF